MSNPLTSDIEFRSKVCDLVVQVKKNRVPKNLGKFEFRTACKSQIQRRSTTLRCRVAYVKRGREIFRLLGCRWKTGIQGQLYAPKLGTQYPVTKVTNDDVTMMT